MSAVVSALACQQLEDSANRSPFGELFILPQFDLAFVCERHLPSPEIRFGDEDATHEDVVGQARRPNGFDRINDLNGLDAGTERATQVTTDLRCWPNGRDVDVDPKFCVSGSETPLLNRELLDLHGFESQAPLTKSTSRHRS